jgi:hypothetical protein
MTEKMFSENSAVVKMPKVKEVMKLKEMMKKIPQDTLLLTSIFFIESLKV